jgi:predicted ATPase
MIHSAVITSGYAAELPDLANKTFTFTKGLNVLFGPNGCGKSTLLGILGAYSGTRAGWSKFMSPMILSGKKELYPEIFKHDSPGGCQAKVVWDGSPSFLTSPEVRKSPGGVEESQDGVFSTKDVMREMFSRPSSGEMGIFHLKKMFEVLSRPPDLTMLPKDYMKANDLWKGAMDSFKAYVMALPKNGPPTILLDEMDRSLTIPNQVKLWSSVLPEAARRFQVIIATHCPYALVYADNVVELQEGYVDECREAVRKVKADGKIKSASSLIPL